MQVTTQEIFKIMKKDEREQLFNLQAFCSSFQIFCLINGQNYQSDVIPITLSGVAYKSFYFGDNNSFIKSQVLDMFDRYLEKYGLRNLENIFIVKTNKLWFIVLNLIEDKNIIAIFAENLDVNLDLSDCDFIDKTLSCLQNNFTPIRCEFNFIFYPKEIPDIREIEILKGNFFDKILVACAKGNLILTLETLEGNKYDIKISPDSIDFDGNLIHLLEFTYIMDVLDITDHSLIYTQEDDYDEIYEDDEDYDNSDNLCLKIVTDFNTVTIETWTSPEDNQTINVDNSNNLYIQNKIYSIKHEHFSCLKLLPQ